MGAVQHEFLPQRRVVTKISEDYFPRPIFYKLRDHPSTVFTSVSQFQLRGFFNRQPKYFSLLIQSQKFIFRRI